MRVYQDLQLFVEKKTELKIDTSKNWEKTEKVKLEICSVFVNLVLCKVACFFKVKIPTVYIKVENEMTCNTQFWLAPLKVEIFLFTLGTL